MDIDYFLYTFYVMLNYLKNLWLTLNCIKYDSKEESSQKSSVFKLNI